MHLKNFQSKNVDRLKNKTMENNNTILCIPQNDAEKRFILAKPGLNNLVCICLNPSTANESKLDATSRNIERIAQQNGFDGWALVNLYPQRATYPIDLHKQKDSKLFKDNIDAIDAYFLKNAKSTKNVMLAWGNLITSTEEGYLEESAFYIYQRLKKHNVNFWSIALTKFNHPIHPAPPSLNSKKIKIPESKLHPFDFASYAADIQRKLKIKKDDFV